MGVDFKSLQQKNTELVELYKEKNRKHQQTRHLYDVLKKKVLMNSAQTAASENVNQTLHSITSQTRPETYSGTPNMAAHSASSAHRRRSQMSQMENDLEQLHTQQRSGSSNHGSDVSAMPPPQMRQSQRSRNLALYALSCQSLILDRTFDYRHAYASCPTRPAHWLCASTCRPTSDPSHNSALQPWIPCRISRKYTTDVQSNATAISGSFWKVHIEELWSPGWDESGCCTDKRHIHSKIWFSCRRLVNPIAGLCGNLLTACSLL